jgi:tetratricopeptide (TPR) repeat protein
MLRKVSCPPVCSLRCCAVILALLLTLPAMASELDDANKAWAAGDISSAVIRLKGLLQANPDDAAARLLLGRIYLDNGDPRAAQQELERAQVNGAEDADVRPPLAQALLAQNKISRALELTETNADTAPELLASLLAIRGSALLSMDDPQAAREAFQQASEANPKASKPLLGLATLALRAGDMERTRALIEQAIEVAPEQSEGWSALGTLEYQDQNYDAAVAAYDKALEYAGSKWVLHYQRGLAQVETQTPKEAWNDAKALQEAMPKFPGLRYLRGRLLLMDGKSEQALNELEGYLRAAPDDPRAIYFAALALNQLERNEQAEEYLVRLRASLPDNAAVARLSGQGPPGERRRR